MRIVGPVSRAGSRGVIAALLALALASSASADGNLIADGTFDGDTDATLGTHWRVFPRRVPPVAAIVEPGARGTARCLQILGTTGQRSTVLRARFPEDRDNLLLDLCFAVSGHPGNALTLHTATLGSTRPTQVRLAVRDGALLRYDDGAKAWMPITDRIEPTTDPRKPRWQRMEILAQRNEPHVHVWLSPPGSTRLPQEPTAVLAASRKAKRFGSLMLGCSSPTADTFVLVDQVTAIDATDLAPPWMRRLRESGRVTFEYYDPSQGRRGLGGLTRFWMTAPFRYRYRYHYAYSGNEVRVSVKPSLRSTSWGVRHRVSLPQAHDRPDHWRDRLVQHEFDHVAVSTDVRITMLLRHLYSHVGWERRTYPRNTKVGHALYRRIASAALAKRREAVTALVKRNYELLDEVSDRGRRPIEDRAAFFAGLYRRENLMEANFPYLGVVESLLESETYRAARPYFRE